MESNWNIFYYIILYEARKKYYFIWFSFPHHIEHGDGPAFEDHLSGPAAERRPPQLDGSEEHVLVEAVQDHLAQATVVPRPVYEQQALQEVELEAI